MIFILKKNFVEGEEIKLGSEISNNEIGDLNILDEFNRGKNYYSNKDFLDAEICFNNVLKLLKPYFDIHNKINKKLTSIKEIKSNFEICERRAENKDMDAMILVSSIYSANKIVEKSDEKHKYWKQRIEEAEKFFENLIEQAEEALKKIKNEDIDVNIGIIWEIIKCYERGINVLKNKEEANKWRAKYKKAEKDIENIKKMKKERENLQNLLNEIELQRASKESITEWPMWLIELAAKYAFGVGTREDYTEAKKYFEEANEELEDRGLGKVPAKDWEIVR